jgi:FlaA1/EpsC-like NDP-sugar epimerase
MMSRLALPTRVRRLAVVSAHGIVFLAALTSAFLLRFEFDVPDAYLEQLVYTLPIAVLVKGIVFLAFRQYSGWWRYVTLPDLLTLGRASVVATAVFVVVVYLAGLRSMPRSVFVLDLMLTVGGLASMRVAVRVARESFLGRSSSASPAVRTLIAGTGLTAESLIREASRHPSIRMRILGLLSDDRGVIGTRVSNAKVVGHVDDIPRLVRELEAQQVIIAVDAGHGETVRGIVRQCQSADVKFRVLPPTTALLDGTISVSHLRDVSLQDLLGRAPVRLETEEIAKLINGETVLVTGAGGSIGSELCRQVAGFGPSRIVLLEQAENPLFALERELQASWPAVRLEPIVADVHDAHRMTQVMFEHRPRIVLHAAAHKHVPLMERNPTEAIKNNIVGTLNVIRAAQDAEVDRVVLISTDKAVNPTSVMGASKRMAEMLVQALSAESATTLAAVRFGNVLGSNGSVIPIFQQQIAAGGPVTVTHPEMKRYFMTIPEATQLVLQAATYAEDGDVFVLDMQEPVRILDVARDLIRLSGLEPDRDIPITFTGIRPGEKLFEELATDTETTTPTQHDRIFRCRMDPPSPDQVLTAIERLEAFAQEGLAPPNMRRALFDLLDVIEQRGSRERIESTASAIAVTPHDLAHD